MNDQQRPFEKLLGYAVYNGLLIDNAWDECSLWGEDDAGTWNPALTHVLSTLAERWRQHITAAVELEALVSRYERMPPDGSLRDAPDAFEALAAQEQELVVFAIHEPLARWIAMQRLAELSTTFRAILQDIPSIEKAKQAYCHGSP